MATEDIEFGRTRKVLDQMLTAHCVLRDRYAGLATAQDVTGLVMSTVLLATVFMDPAWWQRLGFGPLGAQGALGVLSVFLFALTIVDLRVRWKEIAEAHRQAASILARLKREGRALMEHGSKDQQREWLREVDRSLSSIREIPERWFLTLKARHERKRLVSRFLSQNPGASPRLINVLVQFRANKRVLLRHES